MSYEFIDRLLERIWAPAAAAGRLEAPPFPFDVSSVAEGVATGGATPVYEFGRGSTNRKQAEATVLGFVAGGCENDGATPAMAGT
jgi:hypothetical protein